MAGDAFLIFAIQNNYKHEALKLKELHDEKLKSGFITNPANRVIG